MKKLLIQFLILTYTVGLAACNIYEEGVEEKIDSPTSASDIQRTRIAWDYTSVERLGEDSGYGGYPRIIRLKNNDLLLAYEYQGDIVLKKSMDDGLSWSSAKKVYTNFEQTVNGQTVRIKISNPELIELQNGDILLACNYRPQAENVAPFTIEVKRSIDKGETWSESTFLYGTKAQFGNGCWEPSFLQLPDGTVQIYFANENPYTNSDEQEISVVESKDNGLTWTKQPKTVSFRKNFRDGMPAARIINDEIVVSIEDNVDGQFKPYTVRTKLSDNWSKPVLADSPQRNYALKEKAQSSVYMGAPYLLILPSGETMISYQSTRNRTTEWEQSTLETAIGDKNAKNFEVTEYPFDIPNDKEGKWNSIMLWDNNTVAALSSSNWDRNNISVWMKKGRLIPKIVELNTVGYPIFIGSKGEAQLQAKAITTNSGIALVCEVKDNALVDGDGVYFFVDTNPSISNEIYKVWVSHLGEMESWKLKNNKWETNELTFEGTTQKTKNGYTITFNIQNNQLKGDMLNVSFALSNYSKDGTGYVEHLVKSTEMNTKSWLEIKK